MASQYVTYGSGGALGSGASLTANQTFMGTNMFSAPITQVQGSLIGTSSTGLQWLFTNRQAGDVVLNNQSGTSPHIAFYTANNINMGIDAISGTSMRFLYNVFETGGVVLATLDTAGTFIAGQAFGDRIGIYGSNTGSGPGPNITASGADVNINIDLYPKGTGNVFINSKLKVNDTDSSGTPGSATSNTASGLAAIAAASSTAITITNSLCLAASRVFATVQTADATCKSVQVVVSAGSFTLTPSAATTAITKVAWFVIN